MKMPKHRIRINLFPDLTDARNWRLKQSQLFHLLWILRGISVSDHQTNVVADKVYLSVAQAFDEFVNINRRRLFVITRLRSRRIAQTANVGRDDRKILTEFFKQRNPHAGSFAKSMNQNQWHFAGSGL